MSEYTPDSWVILKLVNESDTLYKVLGGWSGGYLDGDSWQMNSGITHVEEKPHHYEFHGNSGSVYKCGRKRYGLRMSTHGVYKQIKEKFGDDVELMPEDTDWREIRYED